MSKNINILRKIILTSLWKSLLLPIYQHFEKSEVIFRSLLKMVVYYFSENINNSKKTKLSWDHFERVFFLPINSKRSILRGKGRYFEITFKNKFLSNISISRKRKLSTYFSENINNSRKTKLSWDHFERLFFFSHNSEKINTSGKGRYFEITLKKSFFVQYQHFEKVKKLYLDHF